NHKNGSCISLHSLLIMKKKMLIPFIIVICCLSCISVNIHKPKNSTGEFPFVWLKKKDWNTLEKISKYGKNTTTVVNYKTRLSIITKVQYKHRNVQFTENQRLKLKKV